MQFIKLQIGCLLVISYIEVTYIKATLKGKIPCNKRFDLLMAVAPWAVFFDGLTAWTVNHQKEEVKKLMATFPTPEDPDWATKDLVPEEQTTQFTTGSSIAFVLEATQGVTSSDEEVEALIVVRDAQGVPVDYYTGSAQWHTMWTGSKYLGQLERTPQTPGDYQLEVYFNRQLVRSMTFTITQ